MILYEADEKSSEVSQFRTAHSHVVKQGTYKAAMLPFMHFTHSGSLITFRGHTNASSAEVKE
jgi:hypothetical protein